MDVSGCLRNGNRKKREKNRNQKTGLEDRNSKVNFKNYAHFKYLNTD